MTTMHAEVAWTRPDDLTDEDLERLGSGLPGFPVTIDSGLYVYLRFEVGTVRIVDAGDVALDIAMRAYRRTFGEPVEPVQLAVYPADPGLIPGPLDLVGTQEVAGILGVTKQRAAQLADRLPAPVGHPAGRAVWARRAVELVVATWDRRPGGRPSTHDA
jgi:hypothetical protein